jgi:prolyl oligopeptidase
VKPGEKYPAVLLYTGDGDTRVAPLHARKMAALLQAATGSEHPVLLQYDTEAGHSAGMARSKTNADSALRLAFAAWQLGL